MKSEKNTGLTQIVHKDETPGGSYLGHLWASIAFTVTLGIICCGVYPLIVWGIAQLAFPVQANGSLVDKYGKPTTNPDEAAGSSLIGQSFSLPQYFHPRPSSAGNGYDPTSSGGSNLGPLSDKLINGVTTTQPAPASAQATTDATTQPGVVAATSAPTTLAASQPSTQPIESLSYDGIRLRTIHYAIDNNIPFKLYNAVYVLQPDKSYALVKKDEVPLKNFEDSSGNPIDYELVDAFPHPTSDSEYTRTVVIADISEPIPGDAVTASGSGLDPHISPENAAMQVGRVAAARNVKPEQITPLIDQYTDKPSLGFLGDPGVNVLLLNIALDAKYPAPLPPSTAPTTAPAPMAAPSTQPAK